MNNGSHGDLGSGLSMTKGIIYYTDFHLDTQIHEICLNQLKKVFSGDDIVSVSLNKSLDLGRNFVIEGERSNTTYIKQIVKSLEESRSDIVYFTEHDVLYNSTHFEGVPSSKEIFCYNTNIWRWDYPQDRAVTYHQLTSLSMLCVYRDWALDHYQKRLKKILDSGFDKEDGIGKMQPIWARALGYEPGTKRRRIGGFSNDVSEKWESKIPNVDIRHNMTLTNPKTHLKDFKHQPIGFKEINLNQIPEWDLKSLFNL